LLQRRSTAANRAAAGDGPPWRPARAPKGGGAPVGSRPWEAAKRAELGALELLVGSVRPGDAPNRRIGHWPHRPAAAVGSGGQVRRCRRGTDGGGLQGNAQGSGPTLNRRGARPWLVAHARRGESGGGAPGQADGLGGPGGRAEAGWRVGSGLWLGPIR
jgi:hypothetical protein